MIRVMSLSDIVRRLILPKATPEPEQLTIAHAGDTLPVTFLRSARARRASLRVDAARRRIVLTAPLRMGRGTAVDFAQAQAGWIAARLKRLPAHRPFVDGAEVRTVESLATGDQLDPVQEAFIEAGAFQCGYCTPGFLLMTTQLLDRHPDPDDDQIRHYLSGNLCRCGAYPEIIAAVKIAARKRKAIAVG